MLKITRHYDFCGVEMKIKASAEERYKESISSPTKEWNLSQSVSGLDICEVCALKIDNALLKLKIQAIE